MDLTLEQFVLSTQEVRMIQDLCFNDLYLALHTYADLEEYTSRLTDEEQFIYALLILEAEGR